MIRAPIRLSYSNSQVEVHLNIYYTLCKEDQKQLSYLHSPIPYARTYGIGEGTFELLPFVCSLFLSHRRGGSMPQTCPSRDFEIPQGDNRVPERPVRWVSRRMVCGHLLKEDKRTINSSTVFC
jgi:hypothetical protein